MDDDAFSNMITKIHEVNGIEHKELTKLQIVILFVVFIVSLMFIIFQFCGFQQAPFK